MKNLILLLFVLNLNVSASVLSQERVTLNLKNVTLKECLKAIEQQTNLGFLYNGRELGKIEGISVNAFNEQVDEVLEPLLTAQGYAFSIENGVILIRKAAVIEALETESAAQEQKVKLRGVIKDEEGTPIPFAAISIKGTTLGGVTDINGQFELEVELQDEMVLVISCLSYKDVEMAVGENRYFEVMLEQEMQGLDEVVVTGYQTLSKERATGAFDKVDKEQIDKPASNISERLVGTLAGVQTTVDANGNVSMEVRGKTSFSGYGDQPLVVVDGFPIQGGLSSINPNDVESVTLLKDAAASSIWGAKSANGVIVVTTKKAAKGKAKVEFSSFWKIAPKLDLDYVNPLATSAEVIEYEKRGFETDLFGGPFPAPSFTLSNVDTPYSLGYITLNDYRLGRISESEMNARLNQLSQLNNKDQIKDHLLQNPFTQQYNLSVSGASERMSNVLTLMYEGDKDYFKENDGEKFMVNYRNQIKVTKWLDFDFGAMIQLSNRTNNGVSLSDIRRLAPYDMLKNEDGSLTDMNHLHYYQPVVNELLDKEAFPYADWSYNPIDEIQHRNLTNRRLNVRLQGGLGVKILPGLKLDSKFMYEQFTSSNKRYYAEESFTMRSLINETSEWNRTTGEVTQNVPSGGALQQSSSMVRNYNFRNQLSFNRTFNDKHAINVIAGTEITDRITESKYDADIVGYDDDKLTVGRLLNDYNTAKMWNGWPLSFARYFHPISLYSMPSFGYGTDRYFSLYSNMAYTYNDKYTISGSIRTDASNLITDDPSYRYSPFWSTGIGWQVHKEEFLKNVDWLDRLNLRATYGFNGNVDRSTSFKPLISMPGTPDPVTNDIKANVSSFGNPTLRWERTRTIDVGVDFAMLKGKLHGTVDVYNKRSEDLIVTQSIPSVHGTKSARFNNGTMLNRGIEVILGSRLPIVGRDIVWNGNLNVSYNKNEIKYLYKTNYEFYDMTGNSNPTVKYVEGHNVNTLWALRYAGLTNVGTETDPEMTPAFHGADGDKYTFRAWPPGVDAREYMSDEGTTVAPYTLGFQNSFKVYDFDVSFIITGKFGHVYRRHSFNYPAMSQMNTLVNNKYSEVVNGDPNQIVPIPENERKYYFWGRFYPFLDYLTADASHIRFQEVNVSYNVPKRIVNKLGFERIRVYSQVNNLGTILFNDFDEDPEYPMGTMKPQPMYTFGFNFSL
ncbi:SusC/RagA family TonB-linked outer membrane protein [Carboxylicivirga mesophila]|uniref:SusC/RagA family TonB-linked outer membrane protein n=1 Tax=Carboxylicivirga mesophila TaxID=1166478 RepID=A0ABS5KEY8_9BACT|nr:SusC/RagA family TonB-linked outer membrane protein [Carboxylicivirga mesophila]MBS2213565.1 SusC/RagA family TonB-linked outer membrane protein [Carboxylicivirga mesophila]